jgi:hypothetical protein
MSYHITLPPHSLDRQAMHSFLSALTDTIISQADRNVYIMQPGKQWIPHLILHCFARYAFLIVRLLYKYLTSHTSLLW